VGFEWDHTEALIVMLLCYSVLFIYIIHNVTCKPVLALIWPRYKYS